MKWLCGLSMLVVAFLGAFPAAAMESGSSAADGWHTARRPRSSSGRSNHLAGGALFFSKNPTTGRGFVFLGKQDGAYSSFGGRWAAADDAVECAAAVSDWESFGLFKGVAPEGKEGDADFAYYRRFDMDRSVSHSGYTLFLVDVSDVVTNLGVACKKFSEAREQACAAVRGLEGKEPVKTAVLWLPFEEFFRILELDLPDALAARFCEDGRRPSGEAEGRLAEHFLTLAKLNSEAIRRVLEAGSVASDR